MADGNLVPGSTDDETLKADPQEAVPPPGAPVWITPPSPWAPPGQPQPTGQQAAPSPWAPPVPPPTWQAAPADPAWPAPAPPTGQPATPGQWPAPQNWGYPVPQRGAHPGWGVAQPPSHRRRNIIIGAVSAVVVVAAVMLAVLLTTGSHGKSGSVPSAFLGDWTTDSIMQSGSDGTQEGPISVRVKIIGGSVGDVIGTATYDCGTQHLRLLGTDGSGAIYVEEMSPPCGQAVVKITEDGSGKLSYTYDSTYRPDLSPEPVTGGGVLTKGTGGSLTGGGAGRPV